MYIIPARSNIIERTDISAISRCSRLYEPVLGPISGSDINIEVYAFTVFWSDCLTQLGSMPPFFATTNLASYEASAVYFSHHCIQVRPDWWFMNSSLTRDRYWHDIWMCESFFTNWQELSGKSPRNHLKLNCLIFYSQFGLHSFAAQIGGSDLILDRVAEHDKFCGCHIILYEWDDNSRISAPVAGATTWQRIEMIIHSNLTCIFFYLLKYFKFLWTPTDPRP